ncbi:hypothetical protein ES703_08722 [subsurface metagenome]
MLDRKYDAGLVVCIHYCNQCSIIVDLFFEFVQIELTLFIHFQFYHCIAAIFQLFADRQDSRVLDAGSDDFAFVGCGSQYAIYGRIITFSTAACKYNLGWVAA